MEQKYAWIEKCTDWRPQSPDLNITEGVWDHLDSECYKGVLR